MSNWREINHARTTRSMEQMLSHAEFKVVAVLRRLIPDGKRRRISQREIARRARVSECTVSQTMSRIDGIFIQRHFIGRGRGKGYEIEMLPPPERQRRTSQKGSLSDPSLDPQELGIGTAQTAPEKGSLSDPTIFYDHDHEQQQQAIQNPLGQLAPETIAALQRAGAHPRLIERLAANNPNCSPAQVAEALLAAEQKTSAHTPPGLALECLARGQRVVAPRARAESRSDAPTDWAAIHRAEEARRAAIVADLAVADDILSLNDPVDAAIELIGDSHPPSPAEIIFLRQRLAAGDEPGAAADALLAARARRPRPEDRVTSIYGRIDL